MCSTVVTGFLQSCVYFWPPTLLLVASAPSQLFKDRAEIKVSIQDPQAPSKHDLALASNPISNPKL